ncbi:hypothetical protein TNCV_3678561 [Trichonephila clavipes]|nr:hypothetical protein TNCV_3678561 [Trichonephila clavipes]
MFDSRQSSSVVSKVRLHLQTQLKVFEETQHFRVQIEKSLSTTELTHFNSKVGKLSRPQSPLIRRCNPFVPVSPHRSPTPLVRGNNRPARGTQHKEVISRSFLPIQRFDEQSTVGREKRQVWQHQRHSPRHFTYVIPQA